ncbi:class I SAM-dependent methyltransferase [Paenibacillus silviterrae]|uniref:class I SAM-dependent methyltransferase n=1 Tax=Paenibacillus silviterrae TaxID=3242194 RepID=UPI0025428F27|nr:class I SAM-dependent methyltransferase [Paenibacillus chinjuensis]
MVISRSCPVCDNGENYELYAKANYDLSKLDEFAFASRKMPEYMHYNLVKCNECDTVYANEIIHEILNLTTLYEEAAYDSMEEAYYASKAYARLLPKVMKKLPDFEGALDIGTGNGSFLEELLEAGFSNVMGVEPSSAPIASAKEHIKPLIKPSIFLKEMFTPESLSLVTCFQTLEHLDDPYSFCLDSHSLLKKDGAIMLVTHSHKALSTRVLGERSPIFDIEHLQLFSPISLKCLLKKAGFCEIIVSGITNYYPFHYWFKLAPIPQDFKEKMYLGLKKSRIGKVTFPLPAGNIVAIGFKR